MARPVFTPMEPSFDSEGGTAPYPAAPPRPPAAGVADIDDAGTPTTHRHGGTR